MRIFKTSWFNRFARKSGLVAREGVGKSAGYRTLICFKQGELAFFVYAFAKSDRQNITQEELADLKKLAKFLFALRPAEIDKAAHSGKYIELVGNANAKDL